jgi:hypothetical protein
MAATGAKGGPSDPLKAVTDNLTDSMYKIFDIPIRRWSSSYALASAIAALDAPTERRDDATNRLVVEISSGFPPRESLSTKYDLMGVEFTYDFKMDSRRWQYGTEMVLDHLYGSLLAKARDEEKRHPDLAARYARAVIILLCEDDKLFAAPDGQSILDEPDFRKLLNIDPAQSRSLTDLMARKRSEVKSDHDRYVKLSGDIFALDHNESDPISRETVTSIVSQAKEAVASARSRLTQLAEVAEVFHLRRVLLRQKDRENQNALTLLVKGWIGREQDTRVRRWLVQSINIETTPAPTRQELERIFPQLQNVRK